MEEKGLVAQKIDLTLPMTDYNVFGLMVCRSCLRSLTMYLKFATVCATTEKYITKYCGQINTNSQNLVELNHVRMFKENENEGEILRKVPLSEIIGNNYQPMENNEDYNIAELICRSCVGPLTSYLKFATVCVTTEEKIIKYCEQIDANGQGLVELNCVRMFCNEKHPKRKRYLNTEVIGVKNVVQQRTGCLRNDANYLIHIKNTPALVHELNSKVEMYECDICHFKTKHKGNLKKHLLVHRENSEVEMYECDTCHFKTKYKRYLKTHVLLHRENSEVKMYECDLCQYKTKHKGYLKTHLLVHRENSEVEMYTCETCQYKTKYKMTLQRHLLIHRKNSEVQMYTCETCKFMTKHKLSFNRHLLIHRENSEVEMYECETCQFKAKRKDQLKSHLKIHLVVHRENIEMETYECKTCHSKTKHKSSLAIQNKDNDVKMYECDKCFKSKFKQKLKFIISGHQGNLKS